MKFLLLAFLLIWFSPCKIMAQFLDQDFERINSKNEKKARRLQTECQSRNFIQKAINSCRNRKVEYYVVNSYTLSEEIRNYDSTRTFTDYLVYDSIKGVDDFIGIVTDKYANELITGCNRLIFENDEYWTYAGTKKISLNDNNVDLFGYGHGWYQLRKHNFIFLFSVEHIDNCIWFVDENRKVFILDLGELIVYDSDEYIRKKYTTETIRNLLN